MFESIAQKNAYYGMKSRNNHGLTVTAEADNLDAATSSLFFEKLPRLDFEVRWNNIYIHE